MPTVFAFEDKLIMHCDTVAPVTILFVLHVWYRSIITSILHVWQYDETLNNPITCLRGPTFSHSILCN